MPFNNMELNYVRLCNKYVNLSEIDPSLRNSYNYTAHCRNAAPINYNRPSARKHSPTPPEQGSRHQITVLYSSMYRESIKD